MELRVLQYFLTVAREQSISAAAQALHLSQPTLSRQLKEMEEDGLIERKQYREMPVRVEYSLTEKAHSMIPILLELKHWGEKHL